MAKLNIMVSRHSAFYTPLIGAIAGGFLEKEGFETTYAAQSPEHTVLGGLRDGTVDVGQSAVRTYWMSLKKGHVPEVVHFAAINERDGFFIAGRRQEPAFTWRNLVGRTVLVDHGDQPLAMFKFACHRMGVDFAALKVVDAGGVEAMESAFRSGSGDYVHLQGPAPQQLEKDGVGYVVAAVGAAFGPVAFSSLVARRSWVGGEAYAAFMRAYRRSRAWVIETPAEEIARTVASYFPGTDGEVLARTIAAYKELGCWTVDPRITPASYEVALDVFLHSGDISVRYPYADVIPVLTGAA